MAVAAGPALSLPDCGVRPTWRRGGLRAARADVLRAGVLDPQPAGGGCAHPAWGPNRSDGEQVQMVLMIVIMIYDKDK